LPDSRPALWYVFSQGRATNERNGIEERVERVYKLLYGKKDRQIAASQYQCVFARENILVQLPPKLAPASVFRRK